MYTASSAFHTAVANGAPQKAMLIFPDAVFTNDDIDVESGIEMDDYFNTEDDIAIGQALSNEIRFTLFNDSRLLNNYAFGDFLATIGARISQTTYSGSGKVRVVTGSSTFVGYDESPYLRRNNTAVSYQPNFAPVGMIAYDGKVYVFGENGQYAAYKDSDGSPVEVTLNSFMADKGKRMNYKGAYYNPTTRILKTWQDGIVEEYEFVPLGYFVGERPNVPDVNAINFTCHDFMTKFDKDMPSAATLGISYPTTISNLFVKICNHVGVSYDTAVFINSDAVITSEPNKFETATMREVMQWIAEAGASNLRFNRDGLLVFDWIRNTGPELTESDYTEYKPYWYQTKRVTKLYNRDSASGEDKVYGSGNDVYLIQDNPLLEGVN